MARQSTGTGWSSGRRLAEAVLAAGLWGMAACGGDSGAPQTVAPLPVGGSLIVPVRHAAPEGPQLELDYRRLPSLTAAPASPIVYLPPGPGQSAVAAAGGTLAPLFERLRAEAEVVLLDQRGTGLSGPRYLSCDLGPLPLDQPGDADLYRRLLLPRFALCLERLDALGVDVGGLTAAESVGDLKRLAAAIGAERLRLLAVGYGTHLALALLRRHPELVERLVLVSVEGPDQTFKRPALVDAQLDRLTPFVGRRAGGGTLSLRASLAEHLADIERQPRQLLASSGRAVVVGRWDLAKWIADGVGSSRAATSLPGRLRRLEAGDLSGLVEWVAGYRRGPFVDVGTVAVDCASFASPERREQIARDATRSLLGTAIDFPTNVLCEAPGLPRLASGWRQPVESDRPVLLVSGELDGRTPPENAAAVASGLSNAVLIDVENGFHGVELLGSSAELQDLVHDFLDGRAPQTTGLRLDPPELRQRSIPELGGGSGEGP